MKTCVIGPYTNIFKGPGKPRKAPENAFQKLGSPGGPMAPTPFEGLLLGLAGVEFNVIGRNLLHHHVSVHVPQVAGHFPRVQRVSGPATHIASSPFTRTTLEEHPILVCEQSVPTVHDSCVPRPGRTQQWQLK